MSGQGPDLTCYMRAMTSAVIRVIVWYGRVVASVVVANQIIAVGHQVALTKTASKGRVKVVDTGVDDGDLDAGASVASGAKLVDLGLHMGGEGVGLGAVVLPLAESICSLFRGDAGPGGDLLLDGHVDAADWPQRLDRRQGRDLDYSLGFINNVFELE